MNKLLTYLPLAALMMLLPSLTSPLQAQNSIERQISCTPTTASGTAYACTPPVAISSYTALLQEYCIKADVANTGAATVDFGPGAKSIKKAAGGVTTDIVANDIRAGQLVCFRYDTTNMQMMTTLGNAGVGSSTSVHYLEIPLTTCSTGGGGGLGVDNIGTSITSVACNPTSGFESYAVFDNSGSARIQYRFYLPLTWTGNIQAVLRYKSQVTVDSGPTMNAAIGCVAHLEPTGFTFNTATSIPLGSGGNVFGDTKYITTSGNLAATNCSPGEEASFDLNRVAGSDNDAIWLNGITLVYTY